MGTLYTIMRRFASAALVLIFGVKSLENCEWIGSSEGIQQSCLPGWYGKGFCGSGRRGVCKDGFSPLAPKHDFQLECCQNSKYQQQHGACVTLDGGNSGSQRTCTEGKTMYGACGSNNRNACTGQSHTNQAFTIQCCDVQTDVNIDYNSCSWVWGNEGENLKCKTVTICSTDSVEVLAAKIVRHQGTPRPTESIAANSPEII